MPEPAANPAPAPAAPGAGEAKPSPAAPLKVTNEAEAIDFFKRINRGEPARSTPAESAPAETNRRAEPEANPVREAEGEREPESQTDAEGLEPEATSPDAESPEAEEADGEELPDTLEGLAETLGLSPDDLASYLKVEIKTVNGTEKVNLSKLIAGNMMEADYRAKTEELSVQRRKDDEARAQVKASLDAWQTKLQDLEVKASAYKKLLGEPPSQALLATDPAEYLRQKEAYQSILDLVGTTEAEVRGEREKHVAEFKKAHAERLQNEYRRLQQLIPEFTDKAKEAAFLTEAKTRLVKDYGFSEGDVDAFRKDFNAGIVLMMKDAFAWRKSQEGAQKLIKQVKKAPLKLKPGPSVDREAKGQEKYKEAMRRVRSARTPGASKTAGIDLMKLKLSKFRG
jgi:hypothetical protein